MAFLASGLAVELAVVTYKSTASTVVLVSSTVDSEKLSLRIAEV
jgi:hypothetical protein